MRRDARFLLAFANRRRARRTILGIDAPAWQRDLTGVRAQRLGALGQQHMSLAAAFDDADQHGRLARRPRAQDLLDVGIEGEIAILGVRRISGAPGARCEIGGAKRLGRRQHGPAHAIASSSAALSMTGNATPPESTTNIETPSTSRCRPSAITSYMTARVTSASSRPRTCR